MPIDNLEAQTIATYDACAAEWAEEHADRSELATYVDRLKGLLPRGDILEIGAGGGDDARMLADAGYGYLGTDASIGMVEAARRNHPDLTFEQKSVYDVPELGLTFDGFWASAVLLHVPRSRIDEALFAIRSVVRAGGAGYISMKDGDEEVFEQREKDGRQENRIFTYWRHEDFVSALGRGHFEVAEYDYVPVSERTRWHRFLVRSV